jgi:hypothetical protein
MPHASDYILYDSDPMNVKQVNWMKFQKYVAIHVPPLLHETTSGNVRENWVINNGLFYYDQWTGNIAKP